MSKGLVSTYQEANELYKHRTDWDHLPKIVCDCGNVFRQEVEGQHTCRDCHSANETGFYEKLPSKSIALTNEERIRTIGVDFSEVKKDIRYGTMPMFAIVDAYRTIQGWSGDREELELCCNSSELVVEVPAPEKEEK